MELLYFPTDVQAGKNLKQLCFSPQLISIDFERESIREKGEAERNINLRETHHMPQSGGNWTCNPTTCPWLEIELVTLQCTGQCSNHLPTLARAKTTVKNTHLPNYNLYQLQTIISLLMNGTDFFQSEPAIYNLSKCKEIRLLSPLLRE